MPHLHLVSATDPVAQPQLEKLNAQMADYYNRPEIAAYYQRAHANNVAWQKGTHHWVVREHIQPNLQILDLGCGSGHAFDNLRDLKPQYTGVDWGGDQLQRNQTRCGPDARFIAAPIYSTNLPANSFDLAFTFYVVEHLVWPHRFLHEIHRVTRPGGLIFIECPHFRPFGRIPSLRYGRRVAPLSAKIKKGRLLDAAIHYYQRNIYYPAAINRRFPREKFPFLINLRPSCLEGDYYPDNDAVYFVDRDEIVAELARLGAVDITPDALAKAGMSPSLDPCFIAMRKS